MDKALAHFSNLQVTQVRQHLGVLLQFLETHGAGSAKTYSLFHQSFRDYLLDGERNHDFWCAPEDGHQCIAAYFQQQYRKDWSSCDLYGLRHLPKHLYESVSFDELDQLMLNRDWYLVQWRFDPSRNSYAEQLDLDVSSIECADPERWSQLPANALLRATLAVTANYLPSEVYETLVYLGRFPEARQRVLAIGDIEKRVSVLSRITEAARDGSQVELTEMLDEYLDTVGGTDDAIQKDVWLVDLVDQVGAERALASLSPPGLDLDVDRTRACERALEIARAAFSLGKNRETRIMLLKCLKWMESVQFPHQRKERLPAIAKLLLTVGEDADLIRVIEMGQNIDIELRQAYTLSEIALLYARHGGEEIAVKALGAAVDALASAERRTTLQFEYAKIALAMARLGDQRCEEYLNEAVGLAERAQQPLWYWDEQQARIAIAVSLARVGLCDEALAAIDGCESKIDFAGELIASLIEHDREVDAWNVLARLNPIVWQRAIAELVDRDVFPPGRYDQVKAHFVQKLTGESRLRDRLEILSLLIHLELYMDTGQEQAYFQQMIQELAESSDNVNSTEIELVAHKAKQLRDTGALERLIEFAKLLPEDRDYQQSNTLGRLSMHLADLGETDRAWELAGSIQEILKRLETYIRVCQKTPEIEQTKRERFDKALSVIKSVENAGFVPVYWGELAIQAHLLGLVEEMEFCVEKAISGAKIFQIGFPYGLDVLNSYNVALALAAIGLQHKAVQMLRFGFGRLEEATYDRLGGLLELVHTIDRIGAYELWDDALCIARALREPARRAKAMLKITYSIARSGETNRAKDLLPEILDCLTRSPVDADQLRSFGELLGRLTEPGDEFQHRLVVKAFKHARTSDRQTVILWTSALLPVFASASVDLAKEAWEQFVKADTVLIS